MFRVVRNWLGFYHFDNYDYFFYMSYHHFFSSGQKEQVI